ncbi:MAG: DUF4160 domain-containing protein [Vitreimonas sp.]
MERDPEDGRFEGLTMPTISLFYGISIQMFYEDHPPPHVHARYNEFKARYNISTGDLLSGALPKQAHRLVREWITLNKQRWQTTGLGWKTGEQMVYIEGLE